MNLKETNFNNEQTTNEPRANLERTPSEPREKQKNADQKNRHGAYGSEDKRGDKVAQKSLLFVWLEQIMNREKKGVKNPVPFHLKQEEKALREGGISSCLCCECKCRSNCSKTHKTP